MHASKMDPQRCTPVRDARLKRRVHLVDRFNSVLKYTYIVLSKLPISTSTICLPKLPTPKRPSVIRLPIVNCPESLRPKLRRPRSCDRSCAPETSRLQQRDGALPDDLLHG
jgi:hypothetical protein